MLMKLSEIAKVIGGKLVGSDLEVSSIKSVTTASASDLTILLDKHYEHSAQTTEALAIISYTLEVKPKSIILVENTRKIFAQTLTLFANKGKKTGISKMISLGENVSLGCNIFLADFVSVGDNSVLENDIELNSGVVIGSNVKIGSGTIIHANAVIYPDTIIGKNCILHSGCIIGADGFGFEPNSKREWAKVPQLAKVIIQDNVEIGANSCIDRGAIQDTTIGEGTKIDNLVQIGHNCQIGKHNVISASVAIAGSTTVGDYCMWGGQSATAGHLQVGNNVTIMGRSGITKDIPDLSIIQGFPAQNSKKEFKEQAFLRNLAKKGLKNKNGG